MPLRVVLRFAPRAPCVLPVWVNQAQPRRRHQSLSARFLNAALIGRRQGDSCATHLRAPIRANRSGGAATGDASHRIEALAADRTAIPDPAWLGPLPSAPPPDARVRPAPARAGSARTADGRTRGTKIRTRFGSAACGPGIAQSCPAKRPPCSLLTALVATGCARV